MESQKKNIHIHITQFIPHTYINSCACLSGGFVCFVSFKARSLSIYRSGWSQTFNCPISASQMLGWQVCATCLPLRLVCVLACAHILEESESWVHILWPFYSFNGPWVLPHVLRYYVTIICSATAWLSNTLIFIHTIHSALSWSLNCLLFSCLYAVLW